MNSESLDAADADAAALAAAASVTEEALALHREALALIAEGWRSQSGCAAVDLLHRQCGDAAELVSALNGAAGEMRSLRDCLEDGLAGPPEAGRDPGFARTAARLGDRPPARFEASVPAPDYVTAQPAAPSAPPPPPAWPLGSMPMPMPMPMPGPGGAMGGSLIALAAQLADMLSRDGGDASIPDGPPGRPEPQPDRHPLPRHIEDVFPKPVAEPAAAGPAQVNEAAPPAPAPSPELPLLAAERPPAAAVEPRVPQSPASAVPVPLPEEPAQVPLPASPAQVPLPASPGEDPRTPCEIAADELPNVGQ